MFVITIITSIVIVISKIYVVGHDISSSSNCPNGYHPSLVDPQKCFKIYQLLLNCSNAQIYCQNAVRQFGGGDSGGKLIDIGSAAENQYIRAFAVFQPITDSGNEYWIGNIDSTQPTVTLETDEFDELNIQTLSNDETDSEDEQQQHLHKHLISMQSNGYHMSAMFQQQERWKMSLCQEEKFPICEVAATAVEDTIQSSSTRQQQLNDTRRLIAEAKQRIDLQQKQNMQLTQVEIALHLLLAEALRLEDELQQLNIHVPDSSQQQQLPTSELDEQLLQHKLQQLRPLQSRLQLLQLQAQTSTENM